MADHLLKVLQEMEEEVQESFRDPLRKQPADLPPQHAAVLQDFLKLKSVFKEFCAKHGRAVEGPVQLLENIQRDLDDYHTFFVMNATAQRPADAGAGAGKGASAGAGKGAGRSHSHHNPRHGSGRPRRSDRGNWCD